MLVEHAEWIAGGALISFRARVGELDEALWLTRADGTHTIKVSSYADEAFISPSGMTVVTAEYGANDGVTAIILKRPDGRQLAKLDMPIPSDDPFPLYGMDR